MASQALAQMTIGATILFLFGAVWLLLGVYGGRPVRRWLRTTLLLLGLFLAVCIGAAGMRASHFSGGTPSPSPEQSVTSRRIGRRFGWITAIEGAAILLAVIVLNVTRRPNYITSVIALVVGLHFFPLAMLFGVSSYYATALLGCMIGIVGLRISDPVLRNRVVGLCFGLLLWATSAAMLVKVLPALWKLT